MTKYQLINPYIEGTFERTYSGAKPIDAAETAWNKLSGYFTSNIPKFAFTMERTSDGKLFHFVVKEDVKKGLVDFSIEKVNIKVPQKISKYFKEKVKEVKTKQTGGKRKKKRKDDDDDSSSDSSDYYTKVFKHKYTHLGQPIAYWWYAPYLYYDVAPSLFVPGGWVYGLTPYVEISALSSAFFF